MTLIDEETTGAPLRIRSRVSAHVLWDYLMNPLAIDSADVPWSVEAITTEWLSAVLCASTPGAEVVSFELGDGDRGTTVRRRLGVVYNSVGHEAGLPSKLFTKHTPTLQTRLTSGLGAELEARFYSDLRPHLAIESPTALHSCFDRSSGRSVHLLRDVVADSGATFCTGDTAISYPQAEQIVDTLATLHGQYFGRVDGPEYRWLSNYASFFRVLEPYGIHQAHDDSMEAAKDVIPGEVLSRLDEIWPKTVAGLAVHEKTPSTVLHSDVHLGNWYITAAGRMGLTDWQCVTRGHWARDLAYALSATLSIEDRREWEESLLNRYLDQMSAQCAIGVSIDEVWRFYGAEMLTALLWWTQTLCPPPSMPTMQTTEMSMLMIERITAAMADLDVLGKWSEG